MFVAWTGFDEHIYVSTVNINGDSIVVPPPVRLGETTNDSPALASYNGKLYLAWTGQGDDLLNLMQLNADLPAPSRITCRASQLPDPPLASAYGRLWVAFTGNTDDLYVSAVDINGANFTCLP